jgi:hypothetical protein
MVTFSLISLLLPEREKRICGLWDHVARSTKESLIRETTTIRDHIIGKYVVVGRKIIILSNFSSTSSHSQNRSAVGINLVNTP